MLKITSKIFRGNPKKDQGKTIFDQNKDRGKIKHIKFFLDSYFPPLGLELEFSIFEWTWVEGVKGMKSS